jgi:rhodanese-related sulfurtransferase
MVEGANHICLSGLQKELNVLDKNKQYYIHCAGGYRSMMAASILKQKGFDKVINVLGGMGKIKETGLKLVQPISSL